MRKISRTIFQVTTLGTILAVLASVIHELSFYWWLAPELVDLPQAGDSLTAAARWLPVTALAIIVGAGSGTALGRHLAVSGHQERNSQSASQSANKVMLFVVPVGGALGLFVGFYGLHYAVPWATTVAAVFVAAWFILCQWFGVRVCIRWISQGKLSHFTAVGLLAVPFVVAFIVALGVNNANKIKFAELGNHSISLRDGGVIENVIVVRNLAAGVLIAVPREGNVRFFLWSGVTSLTAVVGADRKQSRTCEWLQTLSADGDRSDTSSFIGDLQKRCARQPARLMPDGTIREQEAGSGSISLRSSP